jgi:hydrophobe/amphiphile efflux-3 (HAE3) family protein
MSKGSDSRVADVLGAVGTFSAQHPRPVFGLVVVVLLLSGGVALTTVQLDMGMSLYIDDDTDTARNWERLESEYGRGNTILVAVESDDVTDPETIRLLDRLDDRYADIDGVESVRTLADVVYAGANEQIPHSERGIDRAIERVSVRSETTESLVDTVYPESGTALVLVTYGDVATPPGSSEYFGFKPLKDSEWMTDRVTAETTAAAVPSDVSITTTGAPVLETTAFELMLVDSIKLLGVGFTFVFVLLYGLLRRQVTAPWQVFLPLSSALVALVVMLGAMGAFGYNFNAIMLSVLPISLGLGVDYSLQVQTRYGEEIAGGRSPTEAVRVTARTTGRTLVLAMVTTVAGLGALSVSPVPPVRQFGVTAATSVVASMVLSVTFFVALLVEVDPVTGGADPDPADDARSGTQSRSLESVAGGVSDAVSARPLLVLVLVVPLIAGGALAYPHVDTTQRMLDFWPQDIEEREEFETVTDPTDTPQTVYVIVESDDAYAPETFADIDEFQDRLAQLGPVGAVASPVTAVRLTNGGPVPETRAALNRSLRARTGALLPSVEHPSDHPDELLVTLYVEDIRGTPVRELIDDINATAAETLPDTTVRITGRPVLNRNIIESNTTGLTRMTVLSFTVALFFLALALRSVRDAAVLVGSVAVGATLMVAGSMYALGVPWNPGTVSMASIALGVGIDYGLHVFERYREEVERGVAAVRAIETAMTRLARPVLASALTTMAGFGAVTVSRFPVVANFGKTLVLVILFSLLGTFVVLPAVLVVRDGWDRGHR